MADGNSRRLGTLDEVMGQVDFSLFLLVFHGHNGVQPTGALVISSGPVVHPQ